MVRKFGSKTRRRQEVIRRYQLSLETADELVRHLDRAERETQSGDEKLLDKWSKNVKRYPNRGWFGAARRFVECGRDRQRHAKESIDALRRGFKNWCMMLAHMGRDAGHEIRHSKDLDTLLLELNLSLPSLDSRLGPEMAPSAFELLRSAQDLGLSELGPSPAHRPKRRKLTPAQERQERLRARHRRPVVGLAALLRAMCHSTVNAVNEGKIDRKTLRPIDASSAASDCGAQETRCSDKSHHAAVASTGDIPKRAKPKRGAHNRTPAAQLEQRRAKYVEFRTLQSEARREGRKLTDREAYQSCGMTVAEYHALRRMAEREGWDDPRAETDQAQACPAG